MPVSETKPAPGDDRGRARRLPVPTTVGRKDQRVLPCPVRVPADRLVAYHGDRGAPGEEHAGRGYHGPVHFREVPEPDFFLAGWMLKSTSDGSVSTKTNATGWYPPGRNPWKPNSTACTSANSCTRRLFTNALHQSAIGATALRRGGDDPYRESLPPCLGGSKQAWIQFRGSAESRWM